MQKHNFKTQATLLVLMFILVVMVFCVFFTVLPRCIEKTNSHPTMQSWKGQAPYYRHTQGKRDSVQPAATWSFIDISPLFERRFWTATGRPLERRLKSTFKSPWCICHLFFRNVLQWSQVAIVNPNAGSNEQKQNGKYHLSDGIATNLDTAFLHQMIYEHQAESEACAHGSHGVFEQAPLLRKFITCKAMPGCWGWHFIQGLQAELFYSNTSLFARALWPLPSFTTNHPSASVGILPTLGVQPWCAPSLKRLAGVR